MDYSTLFDGGENCDGECSTDAPATEATEAPAEGSSEESKE